ncbi:MAG: gliding motility-associated ABC transporter substrate-binding protein GldG [Bacteroidetes bacterium]|nr:gliding motility-associated ABC transporter substrate-binding protein GldG [Bacteroidota bacterium]MBP9788962.1 gliding motility-associated ABC transporter substrate-binding protein GldG [Bacteroidia bacterium]
MKNKRSAKSQSIIRMTLLLGILIFVNVIAQFAFERIDMTQEKRYSLSNSSKDLAKGLEDIVYFRIYLDGDLPPGFLKLKNSLKEMLDEFRIYSNDNIEYEFIDPSANPDEKQRVELYKQLSQKGLFPTNLEENEKGQQSQKIIFPGAIVNYRSQEIPMQILKSKFGGNSDVMLNNSIENLEYEISTVLRKLSREKSTSIAFLRGQSELPTKKISDAANGLSDFYIVDTVNINGRLNALKDYKLLIIAKPDSAFDEKDKFVIDQFIMKGGRVLWLIDKLAMNMDSLEKRSTNVAIPLELNIDDMLFRYGVRINSDFVLDMQAAPIPVVTGYVGNQPKQEIFPWYYYPLLSAEGKNPIVNNLNMIKTEFASSIDTIETESVTKTVLLSSSKLSRLQMAPARVSLNILREKADPQMFNRRNVPVAVLLEGSFNSNYENRVPEAIASSKDIDFKSKSENTKMIVVSDGDVIASYVSKKGNVYPLGYDRFTRQTFGNKSFILNCIDYLCDNNGVLELRSKEIKLRLLDPAKIEEPQFIQWLNVILPTIMIIIFGMIFSFIRKRKFTN